VVGYIPRCFTCPQTVTHPSSNHLIVIVVLVVVTIVVVVGGGGLVAAATALCDLVIYKYLHQLDPHTLCHCSLQLSDDNRNLSTFVVR